MAQAPGTDNFSQAELDKFGALAQRWWGEPARLRTIGSRAGERPRRDARAGVRCHGRLAAPGTAA
jgi:2-polyprenyl-6-hydroxyphenyl methylase / 3-demethylubiquinone-9 3-methyltransferase